MSTISINVPVYEVVSEIGTQDIIDELFERKEDLTKPQRELLFELLEKDEPIAENYLDEQKMEVVTENLWRRSIDEITEFFTTGKLTK